MPTTVEELFRRLGPQGVRQLNQLFQAGGFSDEEKEQYIQSLAGYGPTQSVGQGLGGISPAPMPGMDPERGPIPSSTPSIVPYTPGAQVPPVTDPILRSPRVTGPAQSGGPDWAAGLATLGAGLGGITRGGGGAGGNVVGAMIAEQRRRQNEQVLQEQRFLNQVDVIREQYRLHQQGLRDTDAAKAAAALEERKREVTGLAEALNDPNSDLPPDQRAGMAVIHRMVSQGLDLKQATEAFKATDSDLRFEATEKDGMKTITAYSKRTGKPVGEPQVIVAPAEQETKGLEGGRLMVTPQRAPQASGIEAYQPRQGQSLMVPEGGKVGQLGSQNIVELPAQAPKPISSQEMDTAVGILSRGEIRSAADPRVTPQMLAQAQSMINQRKLEQSAAQGSQAAYVGATMRARAEREQPLLQSLPQGTVVIDKRTSQPIGTQELASISMEDLKTKGSPYVIKTRQEFDKGLGEIANAERMLGQFLPAVEQLQREPLAARPRAWAATLANAAGFANEATMFEALEGLNLQLARAMQGSAHGLSNLDAAATRPMLPKLTDSYDQAVLKIRQMYEALQLAKRHQLGEAPESAVADFLRKNGADLTKRTGGPAAPKIQWNK